VTVRLRLLEERFLGRPALMAMISCHVMGLFFLPMMPLLLGSLAESFSLNPMDLGVLGSLQLGCTALGALLLTRLGTRWNCRKIILLAVVVELLVNVACMATGSITTIIALRGLSGLAQGMLLAGASGGAAISGRIERLFVLYNVALAVFAVLGVLMGSRLIELYGHSAGFMLFAVVDLLGLVLIFRGLPTFRIEPHTEKSEPSATSPKVSLRPLLALVLFGAALAGTQTFIGRLGDWHGGSVRSVGEALAAGWCLAIITPFLVLPLVRRWGAVIPLVCTYFLVAAIALIISQAESLWLFLIAAALFVPAALFVEPLQFGILGASDPSGRLAALGPAAISVGSFLGPVLAGYVVGVWGQRSIGILAGFFLFLSIVALLPLAVSTYQRRAV
jgi:predicted MFS family arabinose efflux permease